MILFVKTKSFAFNGEKLIFTETELCESIQFNLFMVALAGVLFGLKTFSPKSVRISTLRLEGYESRVHLHDLLLAGC